MEYPKEVMNKLNDCKEQGETVIYISNFGEENKLDFDVVKLLIRNRDGIYYINDFVYCLGNYSHQNIVVLNREIIKALIEVEGVR